MPQQDQSQKQKSKILIIGGLGFIFSHVTEYFAAKPDFEVHVVDNLSVGAHPEILDGNKMRFYHMDAASPDMNILIKVMQPDYVIHAAANSDVDNSIKEPLFTFTNNLVSTLRVFEACRQVPNLKKLLYVSTDEVYGECEHPRKEDEIIFPKNPYSFSKAAGSCLRLAWDNSYPELKNKTTETRFCNVFGPRQDARKIIPAIKKALETNGELPLHGGGDGYREWIYVKEIPPLIEQILLKGNRTYNITTGEGHTIKELVAMAEEITGKKISSKPADRPGMDLKYQMDASRIKEEFSWTPKYTFREAFKATITGETLA